MNVELIPLDASELWSKNIQVEQVELICSLHSSLNTVCELFVMFL